MPTEYNDALTLSPNAPGLPLLPVLKCSQKSSDGLALSNQILTKGVAKIHSVVEPGLLHKHSSGHLSRHHPGKQWSGPPGDRPGHLETLPRLDEGNRSGICEDQIQGASGGWKTSGDLVLGSRKDPEDQHFRLCGLASGQPRPPFLPFLAAPKEQGGDSTVAVMAFFSSLSSLALGGSASPASLGSRSLVV